MLDVGSVQASIGRNIKLRPAGVRVLLKVNFIMFAPSHVSIGFIFCATVKYRYSSLETELKMIFHCESQIVLILALLRSVGKF